MTPLLHPPKPRLVVRVGITGHRPNKLHGAAVQRIEKQLPLLFAAINTAARDILSANAAWYSTEPPAVRLVSSFAEGADQMAVAACPAAWQVEAVLPFPMDKYLEDFPDSAPDGKHSPRDLFKELLKRASAVTELSFTPTESGDSDRTGGDTGNRAKGYANAGSYLLRQIDVLIAVWDGKTPKTGGTGALARQAHDEGIPVVWLSTTGDATPHLMAGFDDDGVPEKRAADCTKETLLDELMPVFSVPGVAQGSGAKASVRAPTERFFQERWRSRCYFTVYDFIKRVASMKMPRLAVPFASFAKRCEDWNAFLKAVPDTGAQDTHNRGDLRGKIKSILLERFIWADTLAEYYAHSYRSVYVMAYLLSAAAVFVALWGATGAGSHGLKLTISEFAIIIAILLIVLIGRRWHWHQRWIDYRALAESLRHGRFLAFVSEFGRIHETHSRRGHRPVSWILWYVRATMREIGLPTATLNHAYQCELLRATLRQELQGRDGQIEYHDKNKRVMGRIDVGLHLIGLLCFSLTLCFLGVSIVGHKGWLTVPWQFCPSLTFWTAGLPALGAALAGIRAQGDFEGSKERSARMLDALGALEQDYGKAMAMTRELTLAETSNLLLSTARVMSEDVAAWQELYGRKWLRLPA
jgi:hypothetical protein